MRALILSAGLGERLRPLTLKRAKPAIEFLNIPMLGFPYFWLDTVDLSDVAINTHYLPETVRKAAMHVVSPNTQMHFCQEDTILGSGGGIWNARFHLQWDSTFAVANADGVVAFSEMDTLEQMLRFHRKRDALATLLVCPLEGVGTRIPGVWMDNYDDVINFGKDARKPGLKCLHYASYMFLSDRIWSYLPEGPSNILYDVLEPAIARGERVCGFPVENMRWFETGNSADYLGSTRDCLSLLTENDRLGQSLGRLLERYAPDSYFKDGCLMSSSSQVMPKTDFRGFSVIGPEARIDGPVRMEDCVVLPGAHVTPGLDYKLQVFI